MERPAANNFSFPNSVWERNANTTLIKPLILIFQERQIEFTDTDPNLEIAIPLSDALKNTGKVIAALVNQADPYVAAAIQDGLFRWQDPPTREHAFRLARVIKADYLAIVKATAVGGLVNGKIELYQNSKLVFQDTSTTSIIKEGQLDRESSALSLANSWTTKLEVGPFKNLLPPPDVENPPPGEATYKPSLPIEPDKRPFENGKIALNAGRTTEAISLLRESVDADPFHIEARLLLIEALRREDKPFLAAEEAIRGARLLNDNPDLLLSAAESYLQGGQFDSAMKLVEEALAKDPLNADAYVLKGDLLLGSLQYTEAVEAYNQALTRKEEGETFYKRAQAYILMGEFEKGLQDIESAKKIGFSEEPVHRLRRYRRNVPSLDSVFISLSTGVSNLIKEAGAFPETPELLQKCQDLKKRCTLFSEYLERLNPVPIEHEKSHSQRSLASILLIQSLSSLQKFLSEKNEHAQGDASLLQVEAMREFAAAQQQYRQELNKPSL
ncbi:MAG TPA: tetratricopeptide repeat protein [Fimbriimonadales bacterium]|nr:tetratricopeptide repeat protein [Fimbriimonadales bacterium]